MSAKKNEAPTGRDRLESMKQKTYDKYRENVEKWKEFSMKPRTEDEIRDQLQKDKEASPGKELCCISYICSGSKLSEDFIDELEQLTAVDNAEKLGYKSKLDWDAICKHQKLSEEFIEKHKDEVNWKNVFTYQDVSDEFKEKHLDRMKAELYIEPRTNGETKPRSRKKKKEE